MNIEERKKNFLEEQKVDKISLYSEGKINEKAIEILIKKAYLDSQPRLISGHENIREILDDMGKENNPLHYLSKRIKEFLTDSYDKERFDDWHKKTCEKFLHIYNNLIREKNSDKFEEQKIGKSQKIINMTLKYLYCMSDKDEKFIYCHMPLDHFTLCNWFYRESKCKDYKVLKKEVEAWSKIDKYVSKNSEEHTYMWFQNKITELLEDEKFKDLYKEKSLLQAELIIWEEEKMIEALRGVANLSIKENIEIYNEDLKTIIKKAKENILELEKRMN